MNKCKKKLVAGSLIGVVGISVFIGRYTAKSFVDNTDFSLYERKKDYKVCYCEMGYDEDTNVGFVDGEKVKHIEDLIGKDTLVVKAKLKSGSIRHLYCECVLSNIVITEVYRGNLTQGDEIAFFEPIDCMEEKMFCTDGYSPMVGEKEYIIFLKQIKNTFYGTGEYVYAPVNPTYGKYLCSEQMPKLFLEEQLEEGGELVAYEDVKGEEVYLYDADAYKIYCELKKELLEKYDLD